MSERQEVRQHPRYAVQLAAHIQIQGKTSTAITKDVSRGGICVITETPATAGTTVRLALSLRLGANTFSESLVLGARVIWCTPIDGRYQLGAVFTEMTTEKIGYLDMFLRFLQQEILVNEREAVSPGPGQFDTGDADDA